MGKIIAIANQKGGVGKTTTSINFAASLVELDRSVLLIDLDPQGNTTMGSGINKKELELSITDVLLESLDPTEALLSSTGGYDILPASHDLTVAEIELIQLSRREFRLRQALLRVRYAYDFIVIDCPPTLNMLTINALVAADSVLIPMQCEYYALEGLAGLIETIEKIKERTNPHLHLEGILRTMFDGRNNLTQEVSDELTAHFPDKLFKTVIPRNVRLAEAPSHGLPAIIYDRRSVGAQAYLKLAEEVVARQIENDQEAYKVEKNSEQITTE